MRAKLVNETIKHLEPRSNKDIAKAIIDELKEFRNGTLWMKWLTADTYNERKMYYCEIQRRAYIEKSDEAWRYLNDIQQQSQEWYMRNQKDLEACYKLMTESIKHLAPKSKDDIKAINDKIKQDYISRKDDIIRLARKLEKTYKKKPSFIEYPSFSPMFPERKAVDFSVEFEFENNFSFYIRTQEFTEGFEVGYSKVKIQGQPTISNWDEANDIDEVEDVIYSWIGN